MRKWLSTGPHSYVAAIELLHTIPNKLQCVVRLADIIVEMGKK